MVGDISTWTPQQIALALAASCAAVLAASVIGWFLLQFAMELTGGDF